MGKLIVESRRVRKETFSFFFSFSILLLSFFILIGCSSESGGGSSSTTTDTETGDTGTADGGTTDGGTADGSSCSASSYSCDINLSYSYDIQGADPQSIRICPSSPIILNGNTHKFTLIGTYENQCRVDLTSFAWWESDNNSSFVNINGGSTFYSTVDNGSFTVTANFGTRNATTQVTLIDKTLRSLTIDKTSITGRVDKMAQLTATGSYTDATTADLTSTANWYTTNTSVATVTAGKVTISGVGTAIISVAYENVRGNIVLPLILHKSDTS